MIPNAILFTEDADFAKELQQYLEAVSGPGGLPEGFTELITQAAEIFSPFFNVFEGGCSVGQNNDVLSVVFFSSLHLPKKEISLPKQSASDTFDGVLGTIRRCLYETVALGNTEHYAPALKDGLMHFGILQGTGYYWSLADHRARLGYGKHPKTFDELSLAVPTPEEESLENLKLIYDNNELELILACRFSQEES